jgi:hypothetical protein
MQVGDLVRRSNGILKAYDKDGNLKPQIRSKKVGIIIAIRESDPFSPVNFAKMIGVGVDVLWANGELQENYASKALEVINESR